MGPCEIWLQNSNNSNHETDFTVLRYRINVYTQKVLSFITNFVKPMYSTKNHLYSVKSYYRILFFPVEMNQIFFSLSLSWYFSEWVFDTNGDHFEAIHKSLFFSRSASTFLRIFINQKKKVRKFKNDHLCYTVTGFPCCNNSYVKNRNDCNLVHRV